MTFACRYEVVRNHEGGYAAQLRFKGEGTEVEETSFMQRKRGRSPTPRRRRRRREERERQRSRQERRHSWTVNAGSSTTSSREVPPRPPVQMGENTIWWSELVGLNDPMNDSSTVLPDQTVDMIITNIREMTVEHRTYMLSELIPFVAAFMSELLRAVATGIEQSQQEVVEVPVEEEDESSNTTTTSRAATRGRNG